MKSIKTSIRLKREYTDTPCPYIEIVLLVKKYQYIRKFMKKVDTFGQHYFLAGLFALNKYLRCVHTSVRPEY